MKFNIIILFSIVLTVHSTNGPENNSFNTNFESIHKINEEIILLLTNHNYQIDKYEMDIDTINSSFYSTSSNITNSDIDEDEKQKLLSDLFVKSMTQLDMLDNDFHSHVMSFTTSYLKYLDELQLHINKNTDELKKFEIELKNKLLNAELDIHHKLVENSKLKQDDIKPFNAENEYERVHDRIMTLDNIPPDILNKLNTLHEEYKIFKNTRVDVKDEIDNERE